MATKPYPSIEEKPSVAKEPAVAYQRTDPATYRDMTPCESTDGLHPFTWEEARKWMAEAEAEDEEGTSAKDFLAELKDEFPWLL